MIVAEAHNHVIGKANGLPWYLPADLKHFKDLTSGHSVIMGRKTFDSIFVRLSKPLPNRRNIVITRDKAFATEGVVAAHSLSEAISAAEGDEVFVIGGASIYREALPEADRIYMTQVDADIEGDAYFPELEVSEWTEREREHHAADEKNPYEYDFVVLERVQG